ncbi:rCG63635 [Rattus norvegicus]|uniref:RCG63635 n=1 Tax=Rattus norvegicus TaxID=10116 RepID=A6I164_RAT|nr:rCG63635 [Rattus norvegicus]
MLSPRLLCVSTRRMSGCPRKCSACCKRRNLLLKSQFAILMFTPASEGLSALKDNALLIVAPTIRQYCWNLLQASVFSPTATRHQVPKYLSSTSKFHFVFFFFLELRTEPRALCLLGKRPTTELNPQPPLAGFTTRLFFQCITWNIPLCWDYRTLHVALPHRMFSGWQRHASKPGYLC